MNRTIKNIVGQPLTDFYNIFKKPILENNDKLINALKNDFMIEKENVIKQSDKKEILRYLSDLKTSNRDSKINVIYFLLILHYLDKRGYENTPNLTHYVKIAEDNLANKTRSTRKSIEKGLGSKEIDSIIVSYIHNYLGPKKTTNNPDYTIQKAIDELETILSEQFKISDIVQQNPLTKHTLNKDRNELTKYDIDKYTFKYIELMKMKNTNENLNLQTIDDIYTYLKTSINDSSDISTKINLLNEKINALETETDDPDKYGEILYLIMSISKYYNEFTYINSSNFITYMYDFKGFSNELQMTKLLKIFDISYFNNQREYIDNNYDSILYFFYEKLLVFYESNIFLPNDDIFKTLFCIFYYCSISYMVTDHKLKKVLPKHIMGMFTDSKAVSLLIRVSVIDNIMFTLQSIIELDKQKTKKLTKDNELCKKWEKYLMSPNTADGVLESKILTELQEEFQIMMETIDKDNKNKHVLAETIPKQVYESFFKKNHNYWFTDRLNTIKVYKTNDNKKKELVNKIQTNSKIVSNNIISGNTSIITFPISSEVVSLVTLLLAGN